MLREREREDVVGVDRVTNITNTQKGRQREGERMMTTTIQRFDDAKKVTQS